MASDMPEACPSPRAQRIARRVKYPDVAALMSSDSAHSLTLLHTQRSLAGNRWPPRSDSGTDSSQDHFSTLRAGSGSGSDSVVTDLASLKQVVATAQKNADDLALQQKNEQTQKMDDLKHTFVEQQRSTRVAIKSLQTWGRIDSEQQRMIAVEASDSALAVSQSLLRSVRRIEDAQAGALRRLEAAAERGSKRLMYTVVALCAFNAMLAVLAYVVCAGA